MWRVAIGGAAAQGGLGGLGAGARGGGQAAYGLVPQGGVGQPGDHRVPEHGHELVVVVAAPLVLADDDREAVA